MIELASFVLLVALTARSAEARRGWRARHGGDWLLDGTGLFVQGTLIPVLKLALVIGALSLLAPSLAGSVRVPWPVSFVAAFVAVDYLYYWNHRAFHTRWLWPIHRVHHSVTTFDVLGTSRNTLWTSFLVVYLWVDGLALFLLAEPLPYALGASLTAALDLWRHSRLDPPAGLARWLRPWLILPSDHAWHHAPGLSANYGANLKLWDRLHGTWVEHAAPPATLGIPVHLPLWRKLLWPVP